MVKELLHIEVKTSSNLKRARFNVKKQLQVRRYLLNFLPEDIKIKQLGVIISSGDVNATALATPSNASIQKPLAEIGAALDKLWDLPEPGSIILNLSMASSNS